MHVAARYGCFPRLIFFPYLSVKRSAFLGSPTLSPRTKRLFGSSVIWFIGVPPSSKVQIWWVCAFVFIRVSKLVLSDVMPG